MALNGDLWIEAGEIPETEMKKIQEYNIMTYNVNCSLLSMIPREYIEKYCMGSPGLSIREVAEKFPEICSSSWKSRLGRIEALIKKYDADIICLQELRKLPGSEEPIIWLTNAFGEDYEIFHTKRNSSNIAFGQAIMWKREKFSPVDYAKKWISPTPNVPSNGFQSNGQGFGQITVGVLLHPCYKEKFISGLEPFWVYNVHLLLEEDLKTKSCIWLGEFSKELKHEAIFAGDFNLFPDKDGDKQFSILMDSFNDLTKGSVASQSGLPLRGTFIGYEHDMFRRKIEKGMKELSKLDQIVGTRGVELTGLPLVGTETMLPEEPKEFDVIIDGKLTIRNPSDHMPVISRFRIRC